MDRRFRLTSRPAGLQRAQGHFARLHEYMRLQAAFDPATWHQHAARAGWKKPFPSSLETAHLLRRNSRQSLYTYVVSVPLWVIIPPLTFSPCSGANL